MTPAETLAAARANVVGPYVPARADWFTDWQGPARDGEWNVNVVVLESFGPTCLVYGTDPTGQDAEWELRVSRIRLDLRRPDVRDHLVRRGAPAWARDIAPALWVWATTGRVPTMLGRPHRSYRYASVGEVLSAYRLASAARGWEVFVGGSFTEGPETGPEGMACADVAALSHGCILEEPDGWFLPLPDGGIGFWPKS